MDYVGFLVERNKNKNENELASWYLETETMKYQGNTGEIMLAETIKSAIAWILRIKSPEYVEKYTRLKKGLLNEQV